MNIEVAIPCYNEEISVAKVIRDFRAALPGQAIVVYDNNSTDKTAEAARQAGARVVPVSRQGKGIVVQKIFEITTADIVVMVDGDDTYEAADVNLLIAPVAAAEVDMMIGTRLHNNPGEFRQMHHFGNRMLTFMLNSLYRTRYQDILSGYRVFSRRMIDFVPLISAGFEIETELMIQAHEQNMAVREIPIRFRERPAGSFSKLNSFRDGYRILLTMVTLLRDHRPMLAFTLLAALTFAIGAGAWGFGFTHPDQTVLRGEGVIIMLAAFGLQLAGLVLNTINVRMRELMSMQRRR